MQEKSNMAFDETVWARIDQASVHRTSAVHDFVCGYREPVRRFILRCGVPAEDAEDLVQEVFLKIFEHELLRKADQKKGRFRSFLLGITKNIIGNWRQKAGAERRGGGKTPVSLDQPFSGDESEDRLAKVLPAPQNDETFDRLWMAAMLRRALDSLRTTCEKKGLSYYDVYSEYLYRPDVTYREIGEKLGLSENQVQHHVQHAKKKLADYVTLEIASYCSSEEEFRDEMAYLPGFLFKKK